MWERMLADQLLRRLLRYGRLEVTYWDGTVKRYRGRLGRSEPVLKVQITDPQVARNLLVNASLAIGEAYTDKRLLIAEDDLPLFFRLVARNQSSTRFQQPYTRARNRKGRQRGYIAHHYDVGNGYYRLFLDPTLTYSCAYFVDENDTLEAAQRQKIAHLLRKLRLEPGSRLLDIGCGWGHLAVTAAKLYGAEVLGITLSKEQLAGARELAKREGVADKVRFKLMNYQDLVGQTFDRIVSVGMFEHVGRGNHSEYFKKVAELLVDDGLSVLHTITTQFAGSVSAWVDKYVFPGGHLPTVAEIEQGLAKQGLWSVDRENLWGHYARTLELWRHRHRQNRAKIVEMFDERFYRMRDFWLAGSEGGFRDGRLGLTQIIFSKGKPQEWPLTRAYIYSE